VFSFRKTLHITEPKKVTVTPKNFLFVFFNFSFSRLFDFGMAGLHVVNHFVDAAGKTGLFVDDKELTTENCCLASPNSLEFHRGKLQNLP
jgi:hypothetical protein